MKRHVLSAALFVGSFCLAASSPARAQITLGDVSYSVDSFASASQFTVGPHGNPIFAHRHYVSENGGAVAEVKSPAFTVELPVTPDGAGGWTSRVRRGNLRIAVSGVLENDAASDGLGAAIVTFTITNLSGSPMTLKHYVFADLDVNGSGSDRATYFGSAPGWIEQVDGEVFSFRSDKTASHWVIDNYSDVSSLLNSGTSNPNLPDGTSPGGPADLEIALQYDFAISAGGSDSHTVRLDSLSGRTCDGGSLLLPDMEIVPSYLSDRSFDTTSIPGRRLLRLSTGTGNCGDGPMEIRGGATHPDGTQDVWQVIHRSDGCTEERLAGEFVYHPSHGHVHFEDWGAFHLRAFLPGGGVGGIVARGAKVSFCLLDITRYNPACPNSPASGSYGGCSASRQGISPGWADVYSKSLDGQHIDVTCVPPGQYWLEAVVDPDDNVLELDETNNAARILIDLTTPEIPEISSRYGNVDTGDGGTGVPAVVLKAGGESGDPCTREITLPAGPHSIDVALPPGGGSGDYALWLFDGAPEPSTVSVVAFKNQDLGKAGFCLPVSNTRPGTTCPCPLAIPTGWTSRRLKSRTAALTCLEPQNPLSPAPTSIDLTLPPGDFTLQGIIFDPNSPNSPKRVSVTNALVFRVVP